MKTTITGIQKHIAKLGIWATICGTFMLRLHNPRRALQCLISMRQMRRSIGHIRTNQKYAYSRGRYFWELHSPGWPSKAFNSFVHQQIDLLSNKKHALQSVIFGITRRCELSCVHCSDWHRRNGPEPTIGILRHILDALLSLGVPHIQFSGGEPMRSFENLTTLISLCKGRCDTWVLTSGWGFDERNAKILAESGCTGVSISLDHWNKESHNRFRGNSMAFDNALQTATHAHKHGLLVSFALCAMPEFVTPLNLRRYATLAARYNASFIHVIEPRSAGRLSNEAVELSQQQIDILEAFYLETNFGSEFAYNPIVTYLDYSQRRAGCFGSGLRYCYIDCNGGVHACPFCSRQAGNCLDEPLSDVLSQLQEIGCQSCVQSPPSLEAVAA